MRFFLDSAQAEEVRQAVRLPYVAGISTNPDLLRQAGLDGVESLLQVVAKSGRRDWKIWVQLRSESCHGLVEEAQRLSSTLSAMTGGAFAGPTLVIKMMPSPDALLAATILIKEGLEVCLTAINNPLQALAVSTLPHLESKAGEPVLTEGPPASRNPHQPHYLATYVERIDDDGRSGVDELLAILDALHVGQRRTRVLAASIRSLEVLEEVVRKVSQRPAGLLDVTLPFSLLSGLLDDPVTRQAADIFAELP
jgi:transaldolase